MMRWWWFGPSVSHAGLERDLETMKEGGIGGVEVQPVYPLALEDAAQGIRILPYLSDEFIGALRFAADTAGRLGLRFDLTLGSGWPFGGPHIPVAHAAGKLRMERVRATSRRVPLPDISEGEKLLAVFLDGNPIQAGVRDGAVWLPRTGEVRFFISSRTGQMVKRAAVGAEGFVLDHYDRAAAEIHFREVGDRLLTAFGSKPPYAVFCDSLEVYGSDWTPDLLEEFRKRRGYDLTPYLPGLFSDIGDKTAAIRYDWGKTLAELAEERFLAPMHEWAQSRRTLVRGQVYGIPPFGLSSNRLVDLAEGEGSQWKTLTATRWASSASHLLGRTITSSETWTWLHSPSFRATPLDVKAEADRHFVQGINQLIGHGWPHTPEGQPYPGWRFYAAGVFNQSNPWWQVMPDLTLYLQRLSFLLRQGRPVNDIAVYLPTSDALAQFTAGKVSLIDALGTVLGPDLIPRLLEAGYGFDFIDDGTIDRITGYRIAIVPGVERMPVETMRKLAAYAGKGRLVATRRLPALAPGLMASEAQHREVREMAGRIMRLAPKEDGSLAAALAAELPPDISLSPATPEIGFVHRKTDAADIYFVANTDNRRHAFRAAFRVTGRRAEWWDPLTGNITPVAGAESPAIEFDLEPYGSRVVVFSERNLSSKRVLQSHPEPRAIDLTGDWKVTFGQTVKTMSRLRSWAEDEDTRYFSGVAAYEKEVEIPPALLEGGPAVRLEFGASEPTAPVERPYGMQAWLDAPVRDSAVVYIDGRRAGSVWCPPYSLDVTAFVKPGRNRLRILAGNTAINLLAGQTLPSYRLLKSRYGVRFEPQDMQDLQPLPSGLLGPLRLTLR